MPNYPINDGTDLGQQVDDERKVTPAVNDNLRVANGAGMTPEHEGKIYDDAKKLGINPQVLRSLNPGAYREVTSNKIPEAQLSPATREFLKSSPSRTVIAQDDIRSLMTVEGLQRAYRKALKEDAKIKPVGIGEAWQQGSDVAETGKAYYRKYIKGQVSTEDDALIAGAEQRMQDYAKRSEKSGLLRWMLTSATEMIPIMVSGGERAGKYGLATGAAAAGTAAIAGQLGPQVAFPEEIATVPGAALVGFKAGASIGLSYDMLEIEAGHAIAEYSKLTDNEGKPLDPTIAKAAALGVGAINAGLEVAGLKAISNTLPINWLKSKLGKKLIGNALSDPGIASSLASIGKKYAQSVGVETSTEMAQESASIIGQWVAANAATAIKGQQFDERDIAVFTSENFSRVLDAGKQAFAASTVLGAPGIGMSVVSEQKRMRHQQMFSQAMDKINEAVQGSLTQGRSVETMRDFLQLSGNGGASYIDADQIAQVPAEVLAKIGITPAQQELAEATGQDVRVRIEDIHTRLSRDEFKLLHPTLKPTAEAMVAPEDIKKDVELATKVSEEDVRKAVALRESLSGFRTQLTEAVKTLPKLRDQAIAVGQTPAEYSANVTKLVERFAARMAMEGKDEAEIISKIQVKAIPKGAPLSEELQQDLSDDAKQWLETLTDAERAALAPSIEHIKKYPDPKGDKANLQMVLELAKDRELHQGAIRLDAPGKSLAFVELLRQWKKAHGDRTPTPGTKEWTELARKADEMDAQRGLVLNQSNVQMPDVIEVYGVRRSTLNSNGKRIAQTEEQVRNFWRWFGDSKVVDDKGRPLVVYHTTDENFDVFDQSRSGETTDGNASDEYYGATSRLGFWFSEKDLRDEMAMDISMASYVKIEEPENKNLDYLSEEISFESAEKDISANEAALSIKEGLIENGIDGLFVKDTEFKSRSFVVFSPSQIKSATGNTGNFDPTNPSILAQAEQITDGTPLASFDPDNNLIKLFSGANLSSVLHELSHFFLTEMHEVISTGVASETMKDDWIKLVSWMSKNGIDFDKTNADGFKAGHEAFARAFEEYLLEGKAPDAGLAGVFSRFTHWLKRIYRDVKALGRDRIPLTDDVRGVLDRMLLADQEAQQASEALSLSTISETELSGLGLSNDEKERIRDTLENAKRKTSEMIDRARNRGRKAMQKEWRDEAAKNILNDPTYQAMAHIKQAGGLRWVAVEDTYGTDTTKALRDKGLIASKNIDGAIPDIVAQAFGFPDGSTLIVALLDAHPSRKAAEDAYVAAQEKAYDASFNAEEIALDAQEYQDYIGLMNKYLNAALGRDPAIRNEAYRLLAEQQMLNYQMKDAANVGFQMSTLKKLLKRERRAVLAGDFGTALIANEQARLAFERARLAREAQKIRDSLIKRGNKTANADRGKIDEQFHLNIINVLQRYGLLKGDPQRFAEWLKNRNEISSLFKNDDPLMSTEGLFGDWLMKDDNTQGWQTLTLGEFKELGNLIKYLNSRGRALVDDTVASLKSTVSEIHEKTVARMELQKTKPPVKEGTAFAKLREGVREFFAATDQLLFVLRRADNFSNVGHNGQAGPAEQLLYTPLAEAFSERLRLTDDIQKQIKPHVTQLLTSMAKHGKVLINAPIPPTPLMQQKGKQWTYESVIAAALNMGNDYNRSALIEGHGMTEADLMALTSILTKDDWAATQGIWDTINGLWPAINEVHYRINQYHQDKVPAKSFEVTTADGQQITMRGGYYPVKFDPELSDQVAKQTEAESLLEDTRAMFPKASARKGFTQKRQGTGGKPIRLSLGVLGSHLDHAVQYITHAEVIRDVQRVMVSPGKHGAQNPFKKEIERTQGKHVADTLQKALAYIARPEGEILDTISKFLERQRSLATAYLLGLNLRVASLQITGATTMLTDLGAPYYLKGVMHMLSHPVDAWTKMREMSAYMSKRAQLIDRDINHSLKQFTLDEKSIKGVTLSNIRAISYVFIWLADAMVAVPAWWGAYHRALHVNGGDSDKAVTAADELIAASNPSARPIDLAHFQRINKGMHRLFTMFSTFTFKYGNRQRSFYNAWKSGQMDGIEYMRHIALEALIPPLMMSVGLSLLWGEEPDEDEWTKAGLALFLYQVQGLPFARDVIGMGATMAVNAFVEKREFVPDPTKSPVFAGLAALQRAASAGLLFAKDLDDDEKMEKAVWAFADLASYRIGVPVPKMARNLLEGMRQWEEEGGTMFNVLAPDPDKRER